MSEAGSEMRRFVLDLVRRGEVAAAEPYLDFMDEVYSQLITVDFPDAVTDGLRRSTDVLRSVLERTRGDLTLAIRQDQMRQALISFEANLDRHLGTEFARDEALDGVLLDVGLSSDQLADETRGFSFHASGPLDLRFDTAAGEPAWQLIARLRENELADIIYQYGEERFSRRIARQIVAARATSPIRTAAELSDLVRRCVPRSRDGIDPATRTFQALRIAVNRELESLEKALARIPDRLKPGGRLAIISFHSLEDRLVKNAFRDDPRLENLTRKPIVAGEAELAANPRSRSAKLRVARRRG